MVFKIFQKLVQKVPIYCYKPSKTYSSRDTILLNSDKTTVTSRSADINTAGRKQRVKLPHDEAQVQKQQQREIHTQELKLKSNIVTVKKEKDCVAWVTR
jgi:hypothetical protein